MRILILVIAIIICKPSFSMDPILVNARNAVQAEKWKEAIDNYTEYLETNPSSLEAEFNLGNVYLQLDSIPQAILHYERALRIEPNHESVNNNIEIARNRIEEPLTIIDDFFMISWWNGLKNSFQPSTWGMINILIALLMMGIFYFTFFKREKISFKVAIISLLLLGVLFLITYAAGCMRKQDQITLKEGVIITKHLLKSGPDSRSDDIKALYPGYKLQIIEELEGWFKVRTRDREIGWIEPSWVIQI